MSLTPTQLRAFVTTELTDPALQTLLDAAASAIDALAGSAAEATEYKSGGYSRIVLARLAAAVSSVTEDGSVLDSTGYRASGYVLTRLDSSGNPSVWGARIVVVYTASVEASERERVQLELVKLDLAQNPGLSSQTIGTWTEQYASNSAWNYEQERAAILATLGGSGGGMVVVDG
jgi:hypothetical protein